MKLKKGLILSVFILLFVFSGCSSNKVFVDEDGVEWNFHINHKYYYELRYPLDWEFKHNAVISDNNSEKFDSFYRNQEDCVSNGFEDELCVILGDFSIFVYDYDNLSLDDWIDENSLEVIWAKKRNHNVSKILLNYTVVGKEAVRVSEIYFKNESEDFLEDVVMDKIYVLIGNKVFEFALFNQFMAKDEYENIVENMLMSFSMIK